MITVKQMRKILSTVENEDDVIYVDAVNNATFNMPYSIGIANPIIWVGSRQFKCLFNDDLTATKANPVCVEIIRKEI